MRRTYKYRLYANRQTFKKAEHWLSLCRYLYNTALEQRILTYRQNRKSLSYYDQQNEMPELKGTMPEYREIGAQTLQDVLHRVDKTYKAFFSNRFGFPRFKSKNRYDSFTLTQNNWKLEGNYLYITKIGVFKLKLSRQIEGNIKTITVKRGQSNKWYACFSCDNVPEKILSESNKLIGIDVGIKSFCVDSEGNKVDNPKYLNQSLKLLRMRQRRLMRRVKGSNRRKKARLLVAKAHEKVLNQRNDFLHKLANKYIEQYSEICIEKLNINGMVKNRHLAKAISDSSWGKFFELLSYKAEGAGRKLIQVNPRGTSQICSQCGEKVEKTLAERTHICPYCNLIIDRDENAARNILRLGQSLQAKTYEVAQCVA